MLTKSKRPLEIKPPGGYGDDAARNAYHVISNLRDGWSVLKHGARRAFRSFETRGEAVRFGHAIARKHCSKLVIHHEDSTIFALVFYGRNANGARKKAG